MTHKIQRINAYDDARFTKGVLLQHGAFLIDNQYKCSFKITERDAAVIEFDKEINIGEVIDEFRFYAEHITNFYDVNGKLIKAFSKINIFEVKVEEVQPSQFYVDADKVEAVASFISSGSDICIPLAKINGELVSLDGHTRLYLAVKRGYKKIYGFYTQTDDYISKFVLEAKIRNVFTPYDLSMLSHIEYEEKWNKFCDDFFKGIE